MNASGGLDVGLYFDLRNPPRWRRDPARLHAFTLEMCQEAEHLGAHSVWLTEHHRFDDDYLAAPLTFAAAIAARTSRVRIGTAIVVAPLHHPAEIAEQAAMVDLVSAGRLDLGIGAGYRVPEYALFGASMERRYGQTDERAREIRRLWGPGGVTPRPVQERPPIWMGYQGPQGARRAGLLGEPLLSADAANWPQYRAGLVEAGHDPATARMAGGIQAWVSDDPEADWPLVAPYLAYQQDSYRRHMVEGTDQPEPRALDPEKLRTRSARILGYFWCDTPEAIAGRIFDHVSDAPVETVFLWASVGGQPEETVARHVQTICTRLAPLLAAGPATGGSASRADRITSAVER
ncbi:MULTISPECIES: LLM class flavin-dependent oxidoreductase [Pseudofrankia]|uniref:LLM class flavin-dependent oxidoreductase n=1 Tax=Pseudofrankia TaxID=2994363 RepID=UPI000234B631|nr:MULTISPECIES: LLM class flavin-dependent oxidoreductase [Pseudofrankia]OHV29881.1 monooxygenase [Pseudofrankia sp. EUN1h]